MLSQANTTDEFSYNSISTPQPACESHFRSKSVNRIAALGDYLGVVVDAHYVHFASREGCRMSKGSMLKLIETNGRGQSGLAAALPVQLHSSSGCLLLWTNQLPPCTRTQVRGAGETDGWTPTRSVRPSSRVRRARRSTVEAAGKQAGTQTCRRGGA